MAKRSSPASRRHWTESDARRVLDEWERVGGTLEAFARSRGLVPQRIAWWQKRLRDRPVAQPVLTLVPATVIGADLAGPAGVIRLPHGVVIEVAGVSASWIAELVRTLARSQS